MTTKTKKEAKAEAVEVVPVDMPAEVVTAFKGFNKNMQCRGFQYEIGKTYIHEGKVEACSSGFHACEYPLDVLSYYAAAESKFAFVEQAGTLARHNEDSKVASSSLTVKASIDLHGLIKAAIEYTFSRVKPVDPNSPASNSGDSGAASNSGKSGIAADFNGWGKASSCESGAIVCVNRDDEGNIVAIRASNVQAAVETAAIPRKLAVNTPMRQRLIVPHQA